jgi:hypothetical protein
MTNRELERELRTLYRAMADESDTAPAALVASVLAIPEEERVGPRLLGSRRTMLLLAAALLLASVVGSAIAIGAGLIPWLDDDRDSQFLPGLQWEEQGLSEVEAGTYYMDVPTTHTLPTPTIRVAFTLPDGWERVTVVRLVMGQQKWLGFGVFENLYLDPCRPGLGQRDPPVGHTVEEIADALRTVPDWQFIGSVEATVDGYRGIRVDLIAPTDQSQCADQHSKLLSVFGTPNEMAALRAGEPMRIWILDVEGTPLVIRGGSEPNALGSIEELQGVIDTLQIQPATLR